MRYSFDHRGEVSGQDLKVASDLVTLDDAVRAFKTVTGEKAVAVHLSVEDWFLNFVNVDEPNVYNRQTGDGSTTFRQNFTAFWYVWRDEIVKRDMDWVRMVHPNVQTIEKWMRETKYNPADADGNLLKSSEDGDRGVVPNAKYIAKTLG